ncbi:MAG TPA: hypothetical protein DDX71_00125 [Ruminococcus sp.]|nr:hypothetical protein [Ruminococcus sp.]
MDLKQIAFAAACLLCVTPLAACDMGRSSDEEPVLLRETGFVEVPGGLDYVAMREWPDAESERIAELYTNTQLNILSERNGWYYVEYRGLNGYVKSDCVVGHRIRNAVGEADADNMAGFTAPSTAPYDPAAAAMPAAETTVTGHSAAASGTVATTTVLTKKPNASAVPQEQTTAQETDAEQSEEHPQQQEAPHSVPASTSRTTARTTARTTTRTTTRASTSRATTRATTAEPVVQSQPATAPVNYVEYPGLGTCVTFGNYYYSNVVDNKTPMTWLVLDSSGDDMLLLSLYAVDVQPYHHALEALTWENSDLRRWLNTTFLDEAFSPEEQERINVTHVFNGDNPYYGTPGGNDTDDQVFLLSVSEAEYYLNTEELRGTWPTLYAESLGAYCDSSNGNWMRYTQWWLRTPGGYDGYASVMPCGWEVNADGLPADNSYLNVAVRPCIRIKK